MGPCLPESTKGPGAGSTSDSCSSCNALQPYAEQIRCRGAGHRDSVWIVPIFRGELST
ncbi:hypothetical protein P7K49_008742, partial [Saguinus oedipus]